MGCHPSHWRTHVFQRGKSTTNQIYTTQETHQTIANTEWYRLAGWHNSIWKIATISGSFEENYPIPRKNSCSHAILTSSSFALDSVSVWSPCATIMAPKRAARAPGGSDSGGSDHFWQYGKKQHTLRETNIANMVHLLIYRIYLQKNGDFPDFP